MIYPSARDWLFSVKTFIASMLALYLALKLELPRPYWAMASVYIVSNPFVGATRSKALYRALGTALGAAAAILFVPPFVETPWLFSFVVAAWTGTMLYLAISDRTARSYVFMLAGYTMPLIALPTVTDPTTVFDVAISRTEEITLGIVCASVVGSVLLPNRLAPTLIERTDAWFRDAAFYSRETLSGHLAGKALSACRQRMAMTVNGLEMLLSQLSYDHSHPHTVARAQLLRGRMQLYLPIVSALADPLIALRHEVRERLPALDALLADTARWFDTPLPKASAPGSDDDRDPAADALRAQIAALQPRGAELASWQGALLSNALWRLRQLVDIWQDCRGLRATIAHESATWRPRYRHWRLGGTELYFDRWMMLFAVLSPMGAIVVACGLWIQSGWNDGAAAVTLAAVSCSFFAALDEPAPQVLRFFLATSLSVVLAGIYLFAVLPHVHDFPMIVLMFAGPFIVAGTLIPRPQFTLVTMLTAVNTATFISIQGAYDADFFVFLNSNLAGVAGLLFAYLWTRVTRPFGAELAVKRLLVSGWDDVARTASTEPIGDQRNLFARMLDRLMQLIPRLAVSDDHRHPSIESFRDLRVAVNALDLRRVRRSLAPDVLAVLDPVLADVSAHFARCASSRTRQPAPPALLAAIDAALARVAAQGGGAAAAPAAVPAGPPVADGEARRDSGGAMARRLRDTLHALVGLRLSLFPVEEAPAREPPPAPDAAQPAA